jgi:exoribonuclease R
LAYKLRDRKFKAGAISFETTEVKFKLDEAGKPIGVYVKERKDAHKLIEDFMLLANRKVAEHVSKMGKGKHKYTFVYRVHDRQSPMRWPVSRNLPQGLGIRSTPNLIRKPQIPQFFNGGCGR